MKQFDFVHRNEGEDLEPYLLRRKEAWAAHYASLSDEDKKIIDEHDSQFLNYFESEDPSGKWSKDCCNMESTAELAKLYMSWIDWCDRQEPKEPVGTQRKFVSMLENRRLERSRGADGRVFYKGISLK